MNKQLEAPVPLRTAVLFLVFNRPGTTAQVFETIRKAKPSRLYVAADGPRSDRPGEVESVGEVRDIVTAVDWPCKVMTLFRDQNLGCKAAVSSAITWFFEHEEQGIILEDDCLPHHDFFRFCEALLERYAEDERVSVITGNNFQYGKKRGEASYYFSKYMHCWGWASWRRAWQHYQGDLPFWPKWSHSADWHAKTPDVVERQFWSKIFDRVRAGEVDSWAYPWTCSIWYYGGLIATPNENLVSNIGFGQDSTHTANSSSKLAAMPTNTIGDIQHPKSVRRDTQADRYVFEYTFGGRWLRFPFKFMLYLRRVAGLLRRGLKRRFG